MKGCSDDDDTVDDKIPSASEVEWRGLTSHVTRAKFVPY